MSACTACICSDDGSHSPCHRDPVDEFTAGCVHEHIWTLRLCQYHAADLAHERFTCGDCVDSADPHRCILVAAPVRSLR